jgi:acyl phosphate:glycerol-3-phosphate acyltransferase
MNLATQVFAILATGYLIGSVPTAHIVMRVSRKKDLREIGTGNVTSTAVMIHGGRFPGSISLIGEILKTFLCIFVAYLLVGELWAYLVMLVIASIGQIWSIWLKGKGGKGQTIFVTGFMVLCPLPFLISIGCMLVIFLISKRFLFSNQVWHIITPPLMLLALLFNPAMFGLGEHSWYYAFTAGVLCSFFFIKNQAANDDIVQSQAWGSYSR